LLALAGGKELNGRS